MIAWIAIITVWLLVISIGIGIMERKERKNVRKRD